MENTPRFFCLDTVMIDIVTKVAALPTRGGDALSSQYLVAPGGGLNAMSAATRHDMPSIYVGRLGNGPFSAMVQEALDQEGIEVPVARVEDLDVGFCVVIVDNEGERTFVTATGAEKQLRSVDLAGIELVAGDYVFLSGYNLVYPQLGAVVAPWVHNLKSEIVVAFDPGSRVMDIDADLLNVVLDRADWLLCNASEATELSGVEDPTAAATELLGRTGRLGVVVRVGARGCVLGLPGAQPLHVEGFKADVVDTNGAGDTHNGVFLSELARGTPHSEAATRANAAAAMAISELGPATCPRRDDVTRRYREFS
jgi:sugar/nucleoside kinase (ribokinase family)